MSRRRDWLALHPSGGFCRGKGCEHKHVLHDNGMPANSASQALRVAPSSFAVPFPLFAKDRLMRLMNFSRADFPDDFQFSAATAAYQIEGQAFAIMVCLGVGILLFSHALDR